MPDVAGDTSCSEHSENDEEECKPPLIITTSPNALIKGSTGAEDRCVMMSTEQSLGVINNCTSIRKKVIDPSMEEASGIITHDWQGWGLSRSKRILKTTAVKSSSPSSWCSGEREAYFPPLLSTLNINGLQRYDLVRSVEEDGRLKIQIVPNQRPQLVAKVDIKSGRLRMNFIRSNQSKQIDEHGRDCDDDETE